MLDFIFELVEVVEIALNQHRHTSMKKDIKSFCWRKKDRKILCPVINQEEFGCCGIIAAIEACASLSAIEKKCRAVRLSIQELVDLLPGRYPDDCTNPDSVGGYGVHCKTVLEYVKSYGVGLEKNYPYQGRRTDGVPPQEGQRLRIKKLCVPKKKKLEDHIRRQPICGEMRTFTSFDDHKKGVYMGQKNPEDLATSNHAVLITGYGIERGVKFFWIKNSYGIKWGEKGFAKVSRELFEKFTFPIGPVTETQ